LQTEAEILRLTGERDALDRALARPQPQGSDTISDALKRRAELVRRIEKAEAEWLAVCEALEQEPGR
ncbi:MAG: hypothetical protein ACREFH_06150, partial [Stellaceae bacterium]